MSLLFSTCLMKWRLCIAIAEPRQSYPAAKKQKQTQKHTQNDVSGMMNDQEGRSHFFTSAKGEQPRPGPKLSQFPRHFNLYIYIYLYMYLYIHSYL